MTQITFLQQLSRAIVGKEPSMALFHAPQDWPETGVHQGDVVVFYTGGSDPLDGKKLLVAQVTVQGETHMEDRRYVGRAALQMNNLTPIVVLDDGQRIPPRAFVLSGPVLMIAHQG